MRPTSVNVFARAVAVFVTSLACAWGSSRDARADTRADPAFRSSVRTVDASRLGASWHAGCPVGPENLRLLTVSHWGFDGGVHDGELVVHRSQVTALVRAFERIYRAHFAIERMQTVEHYGADDHRSMEANNTSAFNCREVAGRPGVWSQHAYGQAIDINPVQNPYIAPGVVSPAAGRSFLDRSRVRRGLVRSDDAVVRAFRSIGWGWGGTWRRETDYQHFSSNGR